MPIAAIMLANGKQFTSRERRSCPTTNDNKNNPQVPQSVTKIARDIKSSISSNWWYGTYLWTLRSFSFLSEEDFDYLPPVEEGLEPSAHTKSNGCYTNKHLHELSRQRQTFHQKH